MPAVETGAREARRRIPVPPLAVVLMGFGLALEVVGFAVRVGDVPRAIARPLSMELPFSVPRLFIAALFAAAALAAAAGAGRIPGRRTWWSVVAVVAAGLAAIKAGSTVHKAVMEALDGYAYPVRALLLTAPVAVAGLGWIWWLSRHERRDRTRTLASLGLYAVAALGLSTISTVVEEALGHSSPWTAAATLVEETGEMLAAVAFLVAVLIGVAPRVVLPAAWVLRRTADEHTLDVQDGAVRPGVAITPRG
ncbi:hypothetical protein ACI789_18535 [Geodermatophilus sp. SYSU D00965]